MEEEKNEGKSFTERQLVIFKLADEEFGVSINEVKEIIRMEQVTRIPNTEEYVKGVINLRGGIIVVIGLARKLGLETSQADKNTRILVVEVGDTTIGMVVDSATEVLRLEGDQIKPPPEVITQKINADYIDGVGILGERLLILLDLAKVMKAKDIQMLQQAANSAPTPRAENKPTTETKKEETKEPAKKEAPVTQTTPEAPKKESKPETTTKKEESKEPEKKIEKSETPKEEPATEPATEPTITKEEIKELEKQEA